MQTTNILSVDVATFGNIDNWKPMIGDAILYNGWFRHWCGFVVDIDATDKSDIKIKIMRRTLPMLLFTMSSKERAKNTISISYDEIISSQSGKWAVIQTQRNNIIWLL